MQLITPTVILQLVVETDLAAAAIHLAIRDPVSKEKAHNKVYLCSEKVKCRYKIFLNQWKI
jgi:hypothetical protein